MEDTMKAQKYEIPFVSGEDITDAAVREVKEETGVDASFLSLVTFRHTHKMMFNNSDIYVILMMKALTEKISASHREVNDCKWLDISEYTNHPHVNETNRFVVLKALEYRKRQLKLGIVKKTIAWPTAVRVMDFLTVEDVKY